MYVTAMAVGQRQQLYSGVRMFTGNYLSSTPRALRTSPLRGLALMKATDIYIYIYIRPTRVLYNTGTVAGSRERPWFSLSWPLQYCAGTPGLAILMYPDIPALPQFRFPCVLGFILDYPAAVGTVWLCGLLTVAALLPHLRESCLSKRGKDPKVATVDCTESTELGPVSAPTVQCSNSRQSPKCWAKPNSQKPKAP